MVGEVESAIGHRNFILEKRCVDQHAIERKNQTKLFLGRFFELALQLVEVFVLGQLNTELLVDDIRELRLVRLQILPCLLDHKRVVLGLWRLLYFG